MDTINKILEEEEDAVMVEVEAGLNANYVEN